jgi:cytochrome c6
MRPIVTKKLAIAFALFFISGIVAHNQEAGKMLFESKCARCHGKNGAKGFMGAADLRASVLTDQQYRLTITHGRGRMPAWGGKLSQEQIGEIVSYIKEFRK